MSDTQDRNAEFEAALNGNLDAGEMRPGDIVEGTIMAIQGDVALIDVGGKSEAILDREELDDLGTGDPVEVAVVSVGEEGGSTSSIGVSFTDHLPASNGHRYGVPLRALHFDPEAVAKHWKDVAETGERLGEVRAVIAAADPFASERLETELRGLAERLGIGAGKLFQPLRVALMGSAESPGIFDVILLLGRDRCLERLDRALEVLASSR